VPILRRAYEHTDDPTIRRALHKWVR
jgi:hypothetical protein